MVTAVLAWVFGVSLPARQDRLADQESAMARERAAAADVALRSAAADGELTDDEIGTAVGGSVWDISRTDATWVIRAVFDATDPLCVSFDVTLPLGPDTRVTRTQLPTCPVIRTAG